MNVTFYWPETGEIAAKAPTSVSGSHVLSGYTSAGMEWVQITADPAVHWMPGGVRTNRPKLAPETVVAPYLLDLSEVAGDTTISDELGTSMTAPGGEIVELPVGTYRIHPPFPWQDQTIEVAP